MTYDDVQDMRADDDGMPSLDAEWETALAQMDAQTAADQEFDRECAERDALRREAVEGF